jgi:acyl-CoA thioester hydrolase
VDGEVFKCELRVGWGQVDFNQHMGNTAYLDLAVDARFRYFESRGLPVSELMRLQIGPVVLRDELEYFSELLLMDPVTVTLELDGLSADGAQMRLRNEFFRSDGKRAARVTSQGLWMNLQTRRPIVPPDIVVAALRALTHTSEYRELPAREARPSAGQKRSG